MSQSDTYEPMIFPQDDGTFTYNITISSGKSYWTSPETKLTASTLEEAQQEAARQVRMLRRAIDGEPVRTTRLPRATQGE